MCNETWKVGELSRLTGITIRTLHHYDEIGLLSPSGHTDSGHRLYSESDIVKLQQIMSLKQLGFALDEIKQMFERSDYNPQQVIKMQIERLDEEIRIKKELRSQMKELEEVFDTVHKPSSEQFIKAIQLIINQKKYFTEEQRSKLKIQYEKFKSNEMEALTSDWNQLLTSFQSEMEKGTSPDNPFVQELAQKWQEGINMFAQGDTDIVQAAENYYRDNPLAAKENGMSRELYEYINKAIISSSNLNGCLKTT
ncbi:MerR family transcriptional regulator [Clostridium rhizosphaerae]|uniref:MerR family transcriptional regulator n=1 Tax=Clostridium rhizosphaerae TaxID=2803861 RepID=UPI00192C79DB